MKRPFLECEGYCPTCDREVTFVAHDAWLRDHLHCSNCRSIPRERALMHTIEMYYPDFRDLSIHESSPVMRGASAKLKRECKGYLASQYDPSIGFGAWGPGRRYRSEDLENQTFEDETFDIVVTQDVFEHLFDPGRAFREIARTLKPGGAHVFTTPLVNKLAPSELCARREGGEVVHLKSPEYHGNPMDRNGSLVTVHWGYDICDFIFRESGLTTTILYMDNLEYGIRAEYIEVLLSLKNDRDAPFLARETGS